MFVITIDNFVKYLKARKMSYFYEVWNQLYYDKLYRGWTWGRNIPTEQLDNNKIVLKAVLHNLVQNDAKKDLKFLINFFDEAEIFHKILIEVYTEANCISDLQAFLKQNPDWIFKCVKTAAKNDRLDLIVLYMNHCEEVLFNKSTEREVFETALRTFSKMGNLARIKQLLEAYSVHDLKSSFIDHVILPTAVKNFHAPIVIEYAEKNRIVEIVFSILRQIESGWIKEKTLKGATNFLKEIMSKDVTHWLGALPKYKEEMIKVHSDSRNTVLNVVDTSIRQLRKMRPKLDEAKVSKMTVIGTGRTNSIKESKQEISPRFIK